jgi:hypothetical protein
MIKRNCSELIALLASFRKINSKCFKFILVVGRPSSTLIIAAGAEEISQ